MARKVNNEEFNIEEFDFEALSKDIFGNDVTTAKLNPDIQGKIFAVIGGNNTGKTTQCARMVKNCFLLPLEKGTNALGKGTQILRTSNWADVRKHVARLTNDKMLLKALRHGVPIGVIIDGLENASLFAKRFICDQAGVDKFAKAGAHGSQWDEYAQEIFWMVTKLSQCGYTLFFIGHVAESKEDADYLDFACDKRTAKPIKDVADFVIYVESNGVDDEGNVIPSSAYMAEHLPDENNVGFFARCRFPYVQTRFKEWDAEVVKQAIYDGIVKQAEIEGAELVSFDEVEEKYSTTFEFDNYKDALDKVFDLLDEADDKGMSEEADNIILTYCDSVEAVKELGAKQMQTIQSIHDELKYLLKD